MQAALVAAFRSLRVNGDILRNYIVKQACAQDADALKNKLIENTRFCLDVCCSVGAELYSKMRVESWDQTQPDLNQLLGEAATVNPDELKQFIVTQFNSSCLTGSKKRKFG